MPAPVDLCIPETDWGCADQAWVDDLNESLRHRAEALAWSTLQALSGYRLSLCPITIRPCAKRCGAETAYSAPVYSMGGGSQGGFFNPNLQGGAWFNGCGCRTSNDCGCSELSVIELPMGVGYITEVTVDGVVLPASEYRVDGGNRLVAMNGRVWPSCQDLGATADQPNTFSVSFYQGAAPDINAAYAAGILATEYAKSCMGNKCALPSGVTTVVRSGVTIEIEAGLFPNGFTGIRAVDAWIMTINPHGLKAPARVMSPDYGRQRATGYQPNPGMNVVPVPGNPGYYIPGVN